MPALLFFFFNLLLKGQNGCDIYIKLSHLMKLQSILIQLLSLSGSITESNILPKYYSGFA